MQRYLKSGSKLRGCVGSACKHMKRLVISGLLRLEAAPHDTVRGLTRRLCSLHWYDRAEAERAVHKGSAQAGLAFLNCQHLRCHAWGGLCKSYRHENHATNKAPAGAHKNQIRTCKLKIPAPSCTPSPN